MNKVKVTGKPVDVVNNVPTGPMLTLAQAANMCGVAVRTMRRRIDAREIPYYKPGRVVRVATVDALAYLSKHRVECVA